jgi:hypothetical protein
MASIISAGTTSGTALNMAGDTSGVLQLATNGSTTALTVDTSQNVGIGRTSGGYKLEVNDTSLLSQNAGSTTGSVGTALVMDAKTSGAYATGQGSALQFQITYSGGAAAGCKISSINNADNNTAYLAFYPRNYGYTEAMRIDSSGNLLFNSGYGSVATAYGCRAWVNFNGTGTVAIRASGNVTSITDNNVGSYTINFTTALVDANYSVSGIPRNTQTYGQIQVLAIGIAQATAPTTSALAITVTGQNDGALRTAIDSDYVCISVFR